MSRSAEIVAVCHVYGFVCLLEATERFKRMDMEGMDENRKHIHNTECVHYSGAHFHCTLFQQNHRSIVLCTASGYKNPTPLSLLLTLAARWPTASATKSDRHRDECPCQSRRALSSPPFRVPARASRSDSCATACTSVSSPSPERRTAGPAQRPSRTAPCPSYPNNPNRRRRRRRRPVRPDGRLAAEAADRDLCRLVGHRLVRIL